MLFTLNMQCVTKNLYKISNKDYGIIKYNYKKNAAFASHIQTEMELRYCSVSHKTTAYSMLKVN